MLDLSKISNLGLYYKDQALEALQRISDVIRSLSDVVVSQSENYLQTYISLQTFDNNGDESTSQVRKDNACAIIQQQYRDIRIEDVIRSCEGVSFMVPDSQITVTVEDEHVTFGFNGDKIFCSSTSGYSNDIYYAKDGAIFSRPNMDLLNHLNQRISRDYTVGTKFERTTLRNDGTTETVERYVWVWFSSSLANDQDGWYLPTDVIVKDILGNAHLYRAPRTHTNTSDYGLNLIATMKSLAINGNSIFYLEPDNAYNYEYYADASSSFQSNSLYIERSNNYKALLSLPQHNEFSLNTSIGRTMRRLLNIPGQIVGWIRYNS